MAYITENSNSVLATVSATVSTTGNAINAFFVDLYSANARHKMIEELQAMDDATLRAKHGIARSQIVGYVFRDRLVP